MVKVKNGEVKVGDYVYFKAGQSVSDKRVYGAGHITRILWNDGNPLVYCEVWYYYKTLAQVKSNRDYKDYYCDGGESYVPASDLYKVDKEVTLEDFI